MNPYEPEIFISYAWGDDASEAGRLRSDFNEQLVALLQKKQFKLIRDRNELTYKDSIRSFMQRIGQGHFTIVIVSEKYLTSKHCMYELLLILQHSNFKERIFPVVLGDARIDDAVEKLKYYEYWEEQIQTLNDRLKRVKDLAYVGAVQEELREYAEYKRIIIDFASSTADMITTRVGANNSYDPEGLLQSLENSVAQYRAEKYGETVREVTTTYNKQLQTLSETEKLRRQEFFTRHHLHNLNLPLDAAKQVLHMLGYLEEFNQDDEFTEQVADAVSRFQSAEGLQPVDGIYGPGTHKALVKAASAAGLLPG